MRVRVPPSPFPQVPRPEGNFSTGGQSRDSPSRNLTFVSLPVDTIVDRALITTEIAMAPALAGAIGFLDFLPVSEIAQPGIAAAPFQICKPTTKRIERKHDHRPNQINDRQ